jgi:hypothetical protein
LSHAIFSRAPDTARRALLLKISWVGGGVSGEGVEGVNVETAGLKVKDFFAAAVEVLSGGVNSETTG